MPLKYFICPDSKQIPIEDCLESCPNRCMSLPTLHKIAQQREWKGSPSTTQLINGTRMEYLKIKEEYAIDPDDYAFALLGTRVHERLDAVAKAIEMISEEKLTGDITGIIDLLIPNNSKWELWDYKTAGSYKIANALDLTKEPVHIKDWELQLNHYRVKLEELGFPICRMVIQAIARDGGTYIAKRNQIFRKINLIEIQKLDNDYVRDYFKKKRDDLLNCLDAEMLPAMCDYDERWANRRCINYCPVKQFCPEGSKMN